jgi:hypothetical protein
VVSSVDSADGGRSIASGIGHGESVRETHRGQTVSNAYCLCVSCLPAHFFGHSCGGGGGTTDHKCVEIQANLPKVEHIFIELNEILMMLFFLNFSQFFV